MTAASGTAPPHRVLVVGGGDVADALETVANTLGWRPTVVDSAEDALAALPDAESVVVLSHHEGVDGPVLAAAVSGGATLRGRDGITEDPGPAACLDARERGAGGPGRLGARSGGAGHRREHTSRDRGRHARGDHRRPARGQGGFAQ